MSSLTTNLRLLALSLLAGAWDRSGLIDRLEKALECGSADAAQLASRLLFHFEAGQAPSQQRLLTLLE